MISRWRFSKSNRSAWVLALFLGYLLLGCNHSGQKTKGESQGEPAETYLLYILSTQSSYGSAYAPMGYSPLEEEGDQLGKILLQELMTLSWELGQNLFPPGLTLGEIRISGAGIASVYFSSEYRELTGISRSLADYAVVLTLCQLSEITGVKIYTLGAPYITEEPPVLQRGDLVQDGFYTISS